MNKAHTQKEVILPLPFGVEVVILGETEIYINSNIVVDSGVLTVLRS